VIEQCHANYLQAAQVEEGRMTTEFKAELERGKQKIADLAEKAESDRQELENQAESERLRLFDFLGLGDFPNLDQWPSDFDEPEEVLFKCFVSFLKKKIPKVLPYVNEFHFESREIDEASLSEMTRSPFGQYLYTEFQVSALVRIPSFSSIKIRWEDRFNRLVPLEAQDISVHFTYSHEKSFAETEIIYWEDETDWDVVLVKAKEQFDPVTNARSKGFIGLK
jgi:hypothetical protein